jgi:ADP-heptose:LPS heptosyltransferase/lauroyl/myristoyl acyltransferase
MPSRRRLVLSNLHYAFPNRSAPWRRKVCRENFFRLIELGLLSIAGNFLSKKRIKSDFKLSEEYKRVANQILTGGHGAIILVPHFTLMETMTLLPKIVDGVDWPEVGVIYRPFDNPSLEKFMRHTREGGGMKLISRKKGIFEAMQILKNKGIVSLLFDQNAGDSGYRMMFFNRIIASTDLPALLYQKFKVPVYFLYPMRVGFWKAKIKIKKLNFDENDPKTILFAANKHLEELLTGNENICSDWLWAHDRWKVATYGPKNLVKRRRCEWLPQSQKYLKINPEEVINFRITVRMPNWLGDIAMAVAVLRTLKNYYPDTELILICQEQFVDFLVKLKIADKVIQLPPKDLKYFLNILKIRDVYPYPDVHISLVNSLRGDIEAVLMGAPKRIGADTKNRFYRRIFINNLYENSADAEFLHQTKLWENALNEAGIECESKLSPFKLCTNMEVVSKSRYLIGMVCGSVNTPRKRWPVKFWRILIEMVCGAYEDVHINLYGTKADAMFVDEVSLFLDRENISNLAGKTTLLELASYMQRDDLVVAIDTGGMHLANMFGCPLVCIYGVTNPLVTGPIYESNKIIVMPDSCPENGGFNTEDVSIDSVFKAIQLVLMQCDGKNRGY